MLSLIRLAFPLAFLLLVNCYSYGSASNWLENRRQVLKNDTAFYFYKGLRYGVQDLYNPVYVIANGGFDILQGQGYPRKVGELHWQPAMKNVNQNIIRPVSSINAIGWKEFTMNEVFPLNWTSTGSQWIPNYFLHMLGSGMEYRMMTEWYRFHKIPVPKLFSAATIMSMHYLNEVVENNDKTGPNIDPIVDGYIFNVAGILLFNSVPVSRFFSEKLHMADWSLQPSFSFYDYSIQNTGQYFIYKWEIPRNRNWALFMRWGMGSQAGVTRKIINQDGLTAAAGLRSEELYFVDKPRNLVTSSVQWTAFFAWDKNNTPLATLQVSGNSDYTVVANVYPGVIRFGKFTPGLWGIAGKDGTGSFGISARYSLGLGTGYGWK